MIQTYFGLTELPFAVKHDTPLLAHQQRHFDILKVHSRQGGLCLVTGEPGTGKSVLKNAIIHHNPKEWIVPVINRSLHTWHNILRLFCRAFELDANGNDHKCEERLIHRARTLNHKGKLIVAIIDDAHLVPIEALRKLRLLLEDFPKNHNLILLGHPCLHTTMHLGVNNDLLTRITFSANLEALAPDTVAAFINDQLDRAGLPHTTFTDAAVNLVNRTTGGVLRCVKNLCLGAMIEAVRDQTKIIDIKHVNAVLIQPHWRESRQQEPSQPISFTNQRPDYTKRK